MGFPVGFVLSPCCRTQKNSVKWAVWFTWVTTSAIGAHCPCLCLRTPAVSAPSTGAPPLPSASSCFLSMRSTKQGKSWSPARLPWEELLLALLAPYFHLTESGVSKPGFLSSFLGSFSFFKLQIPRPHFQTPAHEIPGCPGSVRSYLPKPHAAPHSLELAFWETLGLDCLESFSCKW